jgi:outer membrane biosynthesis protein TonB
VGVRVSVDVSGNVVEAKIDSHGPSAYFAKLALESSRHWKFTPPQKNGAAVRSEWILHYEFGQARTQVHSSPLPTPN